MKGKGDFFPQWTLPSLLYRLLNFGNNPQKDVCCHKDNIGIFIFLARNHCVCGSVTKEVAKILAPSLMMPQTCCGPAFFPTDEPCGLGSVQKPHQTLRVPGMTVG